MDNHTHSIMRIDLRPGHKQIAYVTERWSEPMRLLDERKALPSKRVWWETKDLKEDETFEEYLKKISEKEDYERNLQEKKIYLSKKCGEVRKYVLHQMQVDVSDRWKLVNSGDWVHQHKIPEVLRVVVRGNPDTEPNIVSVETVAEYQLVLVYKLSEGNKRTLEQIKETFDFHLSNPRDKNNYKSEIDQKGRTVTLQLHSTNPVDAAEEVQGFLPVINRSFGATYGYSLFKEGKCSIFERERVYAAPNSSIHEQELLVDVNSELEHISFRREKVLLGTFQAKKPLFPLGPTNL